MSNGINKYLERTNKNRCLIRSIWNVSVKVSFYKVNPKTNLSITWIGS